MALEMKQIKFLKHFVRFKSCNSCGVELQSKKPNEIGYFIKPKERTPNTSMSSIENLKYLMFSQELQTAKHEVGVLDPDKDEDSNRIPPKRSICKRCSDALNKNKYDLKEFRSYTYPEVKNILPHTASVYHVVSLNDFPLSLDKNVLADKNNHSYLLLSKADQITYKASLLPHQGSLFFKEFCKYQIGTPVKQVVLFSSLRNWNISSVANALAKKCYLLGAANVGKSSLINALFMKKANGYQLETDKYGNILGPIKELKEARTFREHLKLNQAGVSHLPNFTRAMQSYSFDEKIVNDLPGYSKDPISIDIHEILRKNFVDDIRNTSKFKITKLIKNRYTSINGTPKGKCLTMGGICTIVPPAGTINQVTSYIPLPTYEFSSIDKAFSVFNEIAKNPEHPLASFIALQRQSSDKQLFERHVIPPFQGSIEVVLKDVGYFQLKPTGRYTFAGLYEIWLPKGIKVCIREPLVKSISTNYEKYLETKQLSDLCPRDRPLVSSTYVMDHEERNTFAKMRELYLSLTSSDLSARRLLNEEPSNIVSKIQYSPPNLYWYYKW